MLNPELIGFMAGILGMFIMVPQIIKSIKTKKVGDVSFLMLMLFTSSYSLWFLYGILINSTPLIFTQAFGFLSVSIQVLIKLKYNHPDSDIL